MDRYKGIGPSFDFLRVSLALLVVFNHSFLIVEGNYDTVENYRLWTVFGPILPMFFALSGFLISGSAMRLKLRDFLLNRGMRIVPALAVDILLSALVIGIIFTTLPLDAYFTDKKFSRYFANLIGFIHYELPGVFLDNPFSNQVNGSLWTVPYEIGCYILMTGLIAFGALGSRKKMALLTTAFIVFYYCLAIGAKFDFFPVIPHPVLANYLDNFLSPRGNHLYFYFLSGTLLYVFRYRIPLQKWLIAASLFLIILCWSKLVDFGLLKPLMLALPIGYLTIFIGLSNIPKLPLYSRGDYSYGIYLYAYPLQQMLVSYKTIAWGVLPHFLCSALLATIVAMLSWHIVEKPALSLRKKFSFTARKGDS